MRQFALLVVLQGSCILAFSQSPATPPVQPQSSSLKPLFEVNGSQLTPPARFWIGPLSGLKTQNPKNATGDVNQLLHAPRMSTTTVWVPPRPSTPTQPSPSPMAKLEPIPTQWPDAKFEQIPTTWLNLKFKQVVESNSISPSSK